MTGSFFPHMHGGKITIKIVIADFPGGPVVKTPHSQLRGPGFDPWSGN